VSRLLKFTFRNAPVRGELVRLTDAWREMTAQHDYPPVVKRLLGEMVAAATLLATTIKFNGKLVMQVHGDGPVKLLVVDCQPDLAVRATAKLRDEPIPDDLPMRELVNRTGRGRFAITLDPSEPLPGQQPYQGIVSLDGDSMSEILETYMRNRTARNPLGSPRTTTSRRSAAAASARRRRRGVRDEDAWACGDAGRTIRRQS
jgi:molecular chaperone Hsp33